MRVHETQSRVGGKGEEQRGIHDTQVTYPRPSHEGGMGEEQRNPVGWRARACFGQRCLCMHAPRTHACTCVSQRAPTTQERTCTESLRTVVDQDTSVLIALWDEQRRPGAPDAPAGCSTSTKRRTTPCTCTPG